MHYHESRLRARYAETDQMGVVYYANYFVWMEVGRVEYCKSAGFRYKDMEAEDDILMVVVEAHCRYVSPARYDDEIIVKTYVEKATVRMIQFGYDLREANSNRLLATGYTRHIFCGRDLKPMRLPPKYQAYFAALKALD